MQRQRAHMAKRLLTPLRAAQERVQRPAIHPLPHKLRFDAARTELRMQIEVHVEGRVPPFAETSNEARRLGKVAALA